MGDRVWEDINPNAPDTPGKLAGDGLQNGTPQQEPGVPGITVELWSAGPDGAVGGGDDQRVGTAVTDANGRYHFGLLPPGDYYLVFIKPATLPLAWWSQPNVGDDPTIDSDVRIDPNDPNRALTAPFRLAAGADDPTWDAGLVNVSGLGSSELGDRVWRDANQNGVQDAGEPGEAGVQVNLYLQEPPPTGAAAAGAAGPTGAPGTLIGTQVTGADGLYLFTALDPGEYIVEFERKSGFVFTQQNVGSNSAVDSDADFTTGLTEVITLPPMTSDRTWDAGIYPAPTNDPETEPANRFRLYLPIID